MSQFRSFLFQHLKIEHARAGLTLHCPISSVLPNPEKMTVASVYFSVVACLSTSVASIEVVVAYGVEQVVY